MGKPSMTPAKRSLLLALHEERAGPHRVVRVKSPGWWVVGPSNKGPQWTSQTVNALVKDGVLLRNKAGAWLTPHGLEVMAQVVRDSHVALGPGVPCSLCGAPMAPGIPAYLDSKPCHRRCLARWQDISGVPRDEETERFPPIDVTNWTEADPAREAARLAAEEERRP